MPACRIAVLALCGEHALRDGRNVGLLLSRYLKEKQDGNKEGNDARDELLNAVVSVAGKSRDLYKHPFKRRDEILGGTSGTFTINNGRMIVGLRGSSVMETGLALNHVYGTPLIPGSALKGLAAHYCSTVWGSDPQFPNFKGPERNAGGVIVTPSGEDYDFMFGSTDDAGFLTFHDAWVNPDSLSECLARDVMTPHHRGYYMSQGKDAAPTDFDDPSPVTFLSVKGKFEIRVSCESEGESEGEGEEGKAWERLAMKLLKQALEDWGIGGKTSSGYGVGTLEFKDDSPSEQGKGSSVNSADAPVQPFSPGQQVEAICKGPNKKGKLQFEVMLNSEKLAARWEGDAPDVSKGMRTQATVKSYDRNSNPPLTLWSGQ